MTLNAVKHDENYRLMQERNARIARVESYSVDRSRVAGLIPQRWSAEALEQGELKREQERSEVTLAEKCYAWQELAKCKVIR